ncbi:MAG: methylamine utilization protein [Pseudomonadota bacterium]
MLSIKLKPVLVIFVLLLPQLSWANKLQLEIVDKRGDRLANAAVIVDDRYLANDEEKEPQVVTVDQVNRQFVPFLTTLRVGSEVVFPNSDNIRHHVYSFSEPKPFELKLYSDEERPSVFFNKPGVVTLGCNIHDQMIAHLLVTDGRVATASNEQGQLSLDLVDEVPQQFSITVWHPLQGENLSVAKTVQIDLSEQTETIEIALDVMPETTDDEPKSRLEQRFNRTGNL